MQYLNENFENDEHTEYFVEDSLQWIVHTKFNGSLRDLHTYLLQNDIQCNWYLLYKVYSRHMAPMCVAKIVWQKMAAVLSVAVPDLLASSLRPVSLHASAGYAVLIHALHIDTSNNESLKGYMLQHGFSVEEYVFFTYVLRGVIPVHMSPRKIYELFTRLCGHTSLQFTDIFTVNAECMYYPTHQSSGVGIQFQDVRAIQPIDAVIQKEECRAIYDAINSLSAEHREIIMRRLQGESLQEVANVYDKDKQEIHRQQWRAVRQLQNILAPNVWEAMNEALARKKSANST